MNINGAEESGRETEALKASRCGWNELFEPRTETRLRSKESGVALSKAMEVMLIVEEFTADWAKCGKPTKTLSINFSKSRKRQEESCNYIGSTMTRTRTATITG